MEAKRLNPVPGQRGNGCFPGTGRLWQHAEHSEHTMAVERGHVSDSLIVSVVVLCSATYLAGQCETFTGGCVCCGPELFDDSVTATSK